MNKQIIGALGACALVMPAVLIAAPIQWAVDSGSDEGWQWVTHEAEEHWDEHEEEYYTGFSHDSYGEWNDIEDEHEGEHEHGEEDYMGFPHDSYDEWDGTKENEEFMEHGNFVVNNAAVVPVPSAVWLFGSGLIGLVGLARRKT